MEKYVLVSSNGTEIHSKTYDTLEKAQEEMKKQTSDLIDGDLEHPNDEGSPVLDEDDVCSYVGERSAYLCPADKQVHVSEDWVWEILTIEFDPQPEPDQDGMTDWVSD